MSPWAAIGSTHTNVFHGNPFSSTMLCKSTASLRTARDRITLINVVGPILGVVPGDGRRHARGPGRSWRPCSRESADRWRGMPPILSDEPTTRPPARLRPRRTPSALLPSDRGREACTPAATSRSAACGRTRRPSRSASSPAGRSRSSRPAGPRRPGRSAGRASPSGAGTMLPCVSQVSLLPRLTCTRLTPASTSRRAISSDQPKALRP